MDEHHLATLLMLDAALRIGEATAVGWEDVDWEGRALEVRKSWSRGKHLGPRISLRGLKRQFDLDDAAVEDLVEELVDAQQVARREGKVVVWLEAAGAAQGYHPS